MSAPPPNASAATETEVKAAKVPMILLVDWNVTGHHETYLALYARALLARGRRVGVLCRDPEGLRARMESGAVGGGGAGRMPQVFARIPAIPPGRRPGAKPGAWARWRWAIAVAGAARQAAEPGIPLVVHFMCLHEHEARLLIALERALRLPWTALHMHARAGLAASRKGRKSSALEKLLRSTRLRGLLVLNDEALAPHPHGGGWPVVLAPDLTDTATEPDHPLAARVRRFAGPAPVVGVLGHLLPSKGVATVAKLAQRPEASGLVFLFAGELPLHRYEDGLEREVVERATTRAPNVFLHTARLPSELDYNALFLSCDVVCATYRDFPHSSNTLTKAAFFERPIIVSEGHLMARHVREYRLGEVVPQGDEAALLAAILRITGDPAAWCSAMQPRWADYRTRQSHARLEDVLARFFGPADEDRRRGGAPAEGE